MWIDVVSAMELMRAGRWRVEQFSGAGRAPSESEFELRTLNELVVERAEALDPQQFSQERFAYLGLENVESGTGRLLDFTPKLGGDIRSKSKVFRRDDVLYGRLRPYLNKVFVARDPVSEGICSGEFFVLRPVGDRVSPLFLRFLLASTYVLQHVQSLQTGSALPRLDINDLLKLRVPIPDLRTQRLFEAFLLAELDKLDELMNEAASWSSRVAGAFDEGLRSGELPQHRDAPARAVLSCPRLPPGEFSVRRNGLRESAQYVLIAD